AGEQHPKLLAGCLLNEPGPSPTTPSHPERIGGEVENDSHDRPAAAYQLLSQHQPQEKGYSLLVGSSSAPPQQRPLYNPRHQQRAPEQVHAPTAGNGIAHRMKRPPIEPRPHRKEKEPEQNPDSNCARRPSIGRARSVKPAIQPVI